MRVTSQNAWKALLRRRSLILNRPANDPHRPPCFFECVDFSRKGIEAMLEERLAPETGSLSFHRAEVKKALEAWKTYNSRQVRKLPEPVGLWRETIGKHRAYVKTIESECRTLQAMLREVHAKEAEQAKAQHRKPLGICKWRNGKPSFCDGRELTVDDEGVVKFKDNGELLEPYLDKVVASKQEKTLAKQKADRERRERIQQARGITEKHRTVITTATI